VVDNQNKRQFPALLKRQILAILQPIPLLFSPYHWHTPNSSLNNNISLPNSLLGGPWPTFSAMFLLFIHGRQFAMSFRLPSWRQILTEFCFNGYLSVSFFHSKYHMVCHTDIHTGPVCGMA
jgi:hypothetical protein